jgi:predicted transcriptional regulator of viral defense system
VAKNIRKGLNATEANLLSLLSKEGKNIFTVAEARKLVNINPRYRADEDEMKIRA